MTFFAPDFSSGSGFFYRLGQLAYWIGTAIAVLWLAVCLYFAVQSGTDPGVWVLIIIVAAFFFLAGRAICFLFSGR
jgi:hypothetical protein